MGKLLHERLREHKDVNLGIGCALSTVSGFECAKYDGCDDCIVDSFDAIADEIERDYITREQHEKELADIIEAQGGAFRSPHHVIKVYAENHGMPMDDGMNITEWLDKWFILRSRLKNGEYVRNVYDASVNNHGKEHDGIICESCSECNYGWHTSANDKPYSYCPNCGKKLNRVYDADGVEIKVDDTVYEIRSGKQYKVSRLRGNTVDVYYEEGYIHFTNSFEGKELTHKEPDSLERIKSDRKMPIFAYQDIYEVEDVDAHLLDRAIALLERGA